MERKNQIIAAVVIILIIASYTFITVPYYSSMLWQHNRHVSVPGIEGMSEIERFRYLFNNWPHDKPKAVIYFLLFKPRIYSTFIKTLKQLDKFFIKRFKYPVVLFHEPDLTQSDKEAIRFSTSAEIIFHEVSFSTPDFLRKPAEDYMKVCPYPSHIGYRHMCRFHTKLVFETEIMHTAEWYWRLDDDSNILQHIDYDIFKHMENQNYKYGYALISQERDDCVLGLKNNFTHYIKTHNLTPTFFNEWSWSDPVDQIYNNFEIASLEFWRSSQVRDIIEYIDQSGGIYLARWGDAPIHTMIVSIFIPRAQIRVFTDIAYSHQLESTVDRNYTAVDFIKFMLTFTVISVFILFLLQKYLLKSLFIAT
ncbi:unnamed protein product [Owenia fusiformis]|uniref:Uncharacterized protein n=1 Tax=Owenia fusiformis TaxID=6347 RepID=A0A8J1XMR4_OWEFU|nr:unnamed protein product [Owenia fusiformis]